MIRGFTENIDGAPSEKQWKRIKARVAEIDGQPVTERIFIDRYWPRPYYGPYRGAVGSLTGGSTSLTVQDVLIGNIGQNAVGNIGFESHSAMQALGSAEAQQFN